MAAKFKIFNDVIADTILAFQALQNPFISSLNPPPPSRGSIAYDVDTNTIWYSTETAWSPISAGTPGAASSFGMIKSGVQVIPRLTSTIITGWNATLPYHLTTGWNPVTGIFTSIGNLYISINAEIAWAPNISNLGNRTLRIMYFDSLAITITNVKEAVTQADPDATVETTQETSINLQLKLGDQVWVEVEHDTPPAVPTLNISAGIHTSLNGIVISV